MKMGEKILRLRRARGWSQEELAEKINVTRQAVSRWESGSAKPDADKIVALSELFGVTADYLLTGSVAAHGPTSMQITSADKAGIYRFVTGVVFTVLGMLMLFALALVSAIDPWVYSNETGSYEGLAGYVLAHNLQWLIVCIVLLCVGGLVMILWRYIEKLQRKIAGR